MLPDEITQPRLLLPQRRLDEIRALVERDVSAGGPSAALRRRIADRCQSLCGAQSYFWAYSAWLEGEPYPRNIAFFTSTNAKMRHGVAFARRQYRSRPHAEMKVAAELVRSERSHTVLMSDVWPTWHDPMDEDAMRFKVAGGSRDLLASVWPVRVERKDVYFAGLKLGTGSSGGDGRFTRLEAAAVDAAMFYAAEAMKRDLPDRFLAARMFSRKLATYFACAVFPADQTEAVSHQSVAGLMGRSVQSSKRNVDAITDQLGFRSDRDLLNAWRRDVMGADAETKTPTGADDAGTGGASQNKPNRPESA